MIPFASCCERCVDSRVAGGTFFITASDTKLDLKFLYFLLLHVDLRRILGDVGVESGIVDHGWKAEHKEQPQPEGRKARPEKEPCIPTQQFAHAANIARLRQSPSQEIAS